MSFAVGTNTFEIDNPEAPVPDYVRAPRIACRILLFPGTPLYTRFISETVQADHWLLSLVANSLLWSITFIAAAAIATSALMRGTRT